MNDEQGVLENFSVAARSRRARAPAPTVARCAGKASTGINSEERTTGVTWLLARIDEEPAKTLDAWMVLEVPFDGAEQPWTRHLVGFRREGCKGQVSSPVEVFDPISRRAMTRSGQVYELGPLPGVNADAFALWGNWKHRNRISHERDVTAEVDELLTATHAHQTELLLRDALARRGAKL